MSSDWRSHPGSDVLRSIDRPAMKRLRKTTLSALGMAWMAMLRPRARLSAQRGKWLKAQRPPV